MLAKFVLPVEFLLLVLRLKRRQLRCFVVGRQILVLEVLMTQRNFSIAPDLQLNFDEDAILSIGLGIADLTN